MSRKKLKKLEEKFRDQIVKHLPKAFTEALSAYYELVGKAMKGKTVKEIAEYHRACRVAVAHLELLIKLAQWADVMESNEQAGAATAFMMQDAMRQVENFRNGSEEAENI